MPVIWEQFQPDMPVIWQLQEDYHGTMWRDVFPPELNDAFELDFQEYLKKDPGQQDIWVLEYVWPPNGWYDTQNQYEVYFKTMTLANISQGSTRSIRRVVQ